MYTFNVGAPIEALRAMAYEGPLQLRIQLAEWSSVPEGVLSILLHDKDEAVVSTALRHPNCPERFLRARARTASVRLLSIIAGRSNCPADVLRIIYERYIESDIYIHRFPQQFLEASQLPNDVFDDLVKRALANDAILALQSLAKSQWCDAQTLEQWFWQVADATRPHARQLRQSIVQNTKCPEHIRAYYALAEGALASV